ncbi:MAG: hypothetical protein ABIO92_00740 [Chloroflexia bacterium]
MPHLQAAGSEASRSGWRQFARRLIMAFVLFLFMSLSLLLSGGFVFAIVPVTLLVCGGLLTGIAATNLFDGQRPMRLAWAGLTLGAYLAIAVPALVVGTSAMIDALGAVVALTLVPHLGRHDPGAALRDWSVVIGNSLYVAFGVQAMSALVSSLGLPVFFIVAIVPPLLFEALMLFFSRDGPRSIWSYVIPLVLSIVTSVALLSLTQFNRSMPDGWVLFFGLVVGILIGVGLLLSYMTRRMAEAASGARNGANPLARSLVELSHGPVIISLALYLPVSLLR